METVEIGLNGINYYIKALIIIYCFELNFFSLYRLACGIIARSSGLLQNTKKICACDGLTIWEERDQALANNHGTKSYIELNEKICTII